MDPKLETEIAIVKEQLKYIIEKVDRIQDNHLPHFYQRLELIGNRLNKIEQRFAYYIGGLGVVVVVAELLLRVFIK